jgi:site-specific DNA-adenine methylase
MKDRLILFRWYGGKSNLFKKILPYLNTPHTVYVEAYGGGASVLLNKLPSPVEVLNDINSEIVNIFRVLQDEVKFKELKHRLEWTLYSRAEFVKAIDIVQNGNVTDPVLRAWAFFVAQNQGFAGKDCMSFSEGNWGRSFIRNQATAFADKVESLETVRNRLKNVLLDNIDAMLAIKGQAVLSGYAHEIYKPLLEQGWHKVEIDTVCRAAGKTRESKLRGEGSLIQHAKRVEVLYLKLRNETLLF